MTNKQKHEIKNNHHKCRQTPTQRHYLNLGKTDITRVVFSCWCGKYEFKHYLGKLELADIIRGRGELKADYFEELGINMPVYSPVN